jgi:hypothetical protein
MYIGRLPVSECRRHVTNALNESACGAEEIQRRECPSTSTPNHSEWHVLTWCYRRITTTFQEQLSAFREGEEKRLAKLVLFQVSNRSRLV